MKINPDSDLRNFDFCLSTFARCVKQRDWPGLKRLLDSPLFTQAIKTFKSEFPDEFEKFRDKIKGE